MKFERQRIHQSIPDKYELSNQQFLTFRNNPIQNTGRSVYSQQFDYKSLDKFQKLEEQVQPSYNFRKNIKNIRSQDKYKQLKQEAIMDQMMNENNESHNISAFEKNEELKTKYAKLIKNVKREQKKQHILAQQINIIESDIEEINQTIAKYHSDIEQLNEIYEQNEKNFSSMLKKKEEIETQGKELQSKLAYFTDTIESEAKSGRNKEFTSLDYQKKLLQGIGELQIYREKIEEKIQFFEQQLTRFKGNIENVFFVDNSIKLLSQK